MKNAAIIFGLLFSFALNGLAGVPTKEINKDKVLAAGPEWQQNYDKYNPSPDQVSALNSKIGENLRVDVYLGLWCPDSERNVPPFIKIMELVGSDVPLKFISVYRKPVKTIKYFVDDVQVEKVPTFIFYRGDKEIGRIIENPKTGMIEDMIEIMAK